MVDRQEAAVHHRSRVDRAVHAARPPMQRRHGLDPPGRRCPERRRHLQPRAQPVLMEPVAAPRAGEPRALDALDRRDRLLGVDRRPVELRVCVGERRERASRLDGAGSESRRPAARVRRPCSRFIQ